MKQTNSYKPTGYRLAAVRFVNADGTGEKNIADAGANDSAIKGLIITSDDPSARDLQLIVYDGANSFIFDTRPIPAGSGTDGVNGPVDGLTGAFLPLDGTGKKFLPLQGFGTTWSLRGAMLAAVTAAKTVTVLAIFEDY